MTTPLEMALEITKMLNKAINWMGDQGAHITRDYPELYQSKLTADTLIARLKEMEWQPIATAPKNGVVVILYGLHKDEDDADYPTTPYVISGRWHEAEKDGMDYMGCDAGFRDCDCSIFFPSRSFGNPSCMSNGFQPTQWMPLPQPPAPATPERE